MAGLSDGRRRLLFRGRVVNLCGRLLVRDRLPGRASPSTIVLPEPQRYRMPVLMGMACLFLFVFECPPQLAMGQSRPVQNAPVMTIDRSIGSEEMLISDVSFEGDLFFKRPILELRVRSKPNRELLGIPGATWWLWLYKFGENTLGGNGIGKAFKATGEPPALFDSTTVANDLERLQLFYFLDEGFQQSAISAAVTRNGTSNKVSIVYHIEAGPPTFIRNFKYNGLDSLSHDQKVRIARGSLLDLDVDESMPDPLVHSLQNNRYSGPLLTEEWRRLLTALHVEGYAAVTRDSIHAVVYTISPDTVDVTIDVKLGPRYRFGDVLFAVNGTEPGADDRQVVDSVKSSVSGVEGGIISAGFKAERRLTFEPLRDNLKFAPGDWYDQSKLIATKRRLDGIRALAFTDIQSVEPQTIETTTPGAAPRLPHRFSIQTRPRHQMRLQTFILQRNDSFEGNKNEWGFGVGVTYNNFNLFGGGENFSVNASTSLTSELDASKGFSSAQWEVGANLAFPRLTWPMGRLESLLDLENVLSHVTISFLAARRDALFLIIRGRGQARYRFELKHSRTFTSFFDLLELTVSNPDTLEGFRESFLDDILDTIDDPNQRARIIQDYTEPQFNDALRLTLRQTDLNLLRRENGHVYEVGLEAGGNIGFLLDRFIFTPDTLEGSLPGLPIFGATGSSNRLFYGQYIRGVVDVRKYIRLNTLSVFAWKIIVGAAHPYGEAPVIPLSRRFFSGGSSSVRAWHLSELGPGSASIQTEDDKNESLNTNIFGGEIKLEGSIELRHTVFRDVFSANWIFTVFMDAGNVWFGPRNPGPVAGRFRADEFFTELGIGAGFGFRLAWDYLVVRLDFASKVHDPVRKGELWPDGFSEPVIHFGFGHTF